MPRRVQNSASNAAKTKEEAQARAAMMERHVRDQAADMRYHLVTGANHQRVLSAKYVADRYLKDLKEWLRNESQRRACTPGFARAMEGRLVGLKRELRELQVASQNRPTERQRRRREARQQRQEEAYVAERAAAREAFERARAALEAIEDRGRLPAALSSSDDESDG